MPTPDAGGRGSIDANTGTWDECIRPARAGGDPHGNGRQLLGIGFPIPNPAGDPVFMEVESIDATAIADKDGNPISSVVVHNHELTGSVSRNGRTEAITGSGWVGAQLHGKIRCRSNRQWLFPVTLHVAQVNATGKAGGDLGGRPAPSVQFALELDSPTGSGPRTAACAWPISTPDNATRNAAFPVQGYWDSTGKYFPDDHTISFACVDDAVVKCLKEGYPIHDDDTGKHDKDTDKEALFKACTRAMRADYCGKGISFTRDGTKVVFRDTSDIAHDPPNPALGFEAAWSSEGMFCLGHLRYEIRDLPDDDEWQSASSCTRDTPKHHPKYCKTYQEAQVLNQATPRPLIFSDSCSKHPCSGENPSTARPLK